LTCCCCCCCASFMRAQVKGWPQVRPSSTANGHSSCCSGCWLSSPWLSASRHARHRRWQQGSTSKGEPSHSASPHDEQDGEEDDIQNFRNGTAKETASARMRVPDHDVVYGEKHGRSCMREPGHCHARTSSRMSRHPGTTTTSRPSRHSPHSAERQLPRSAHFAQQHTALSTCLRLPPSPSSSPAPPGTLCLPSVRVVQITWGR